MRPSATPALAERTSEITYPGAAEHIRAVRADLRPLLVGCPIADEMILCASELAANAALHSNSRLPGGTFTVRAEISPGVIGLLICARIDDQRQRPFVTGYSRADRPASGLRRHPRPYACRTPSASGRRRPA
jgi:anti-sigma regulatory factor (Ser/Thr protein kinase)